MITIISQRKLLSMGYEQITALAHATSLTPPVGAISAIMKCEGSVRWRDDGIAPTASVGMPINIGDEFFYDGSLSAFRVIQSGVGVAKLNVTYYW